MGNDIIIAILPDLPEVIGREIMIRILSLVVVVVLIHQFC